MYARRIKYKNQRWNYIFRPDKYLFSSSSRDYTVGKSLSSGLISRNHTSRVSLIDRYISNSRSDISWRSCLVRLYSSEGDGRNASEDKCVTAKDVNNVHKEKIQNVNTVDNAKNSNAHARLGESDQAEWLRNEKLAIESKKKESPFLTRREKFRNEFLRRIVPWEKITVSWDTFPYYIDGNAKNLLVECTTAHLKHKKFTSDFGSDLTSSSGRILLRSIPGTELYRERFVRALARDLQVPLLVLDSSVLALYDFDEDCSSESETDEESMSESEIEDANDTSNGEEDYTSSSETNGSDNEIDIQASAEALKKLIPYHIEEFEKSVSGDSESSSTSSTSESADSDNVIQPIKKGDRVKYVGPTVLVKAHNRIVLGKIPTSDGPRHAYTVTRSRDMSSGQRGEVYEVNGDQVAVIFDISGKPTKDDECDHESADPAVNSSICWVNVKDIEHDLDAESRDCYVAMEVLCEILKSQQPLIAYFPDSSLWLSRAVWKSNRKDFVDKLQEMFDQLSGPVVLICGQNKMETGSGKEKGKFLSLR